MLGDHGDGNAMIPQCSDEVGIVEPDRFIAVATLVLPGEALALDPDFAHLVGFDGLEELGIRPLGLRTGNGCRAEPARKGQQDNDDNRPSPRTPSTSAQ